MRTLLPGGVLLGVLLTVSACSPGLAVDAYPTERGTEIDCKALYADAPRQVAGEDAILVEDDTAVAWGAPPIILRCGVEKPAILDPEDPADVPPCNFVDGVDWVSETTADGYLFTTIGRAFYVSVEVPKDYDPAADALADVAAAVKKHDPSVTPCE
ncbi:DUF3515 family protein [Aeromicrobium stalagmiti]|uniref:DUF3515 family protein n=1 Tax=Aeromicrobium stalagmiti TaxID=2738988 RepID=UPI001568F906|nr:DUF3515 family protein [Aeromicrobium stalagmiti]